MDYPLSGYAAWLAAAAGLYMLAATDEPVIGGILFAIGIVVMLNSKPRSAE